VREALWEVYQPFRDLKVVAGAGAAADLVPLEECPAVKLPDSSHAGELLRTRHLFVARWQRPDNTAPAFRVTRTLGRYLAAWINRYPTATGPVMLGELPDKTCTARSSCLAALP
jgi:hypothetical protein